MDTMPDPATILQELDTIRAATLRRLAGLTQEQLDWRPPDGAGEAAWSLGEVFMHLAIDEYFLVEQFGRLWLEGGAPPDGERSLPPPPAGVPADEIRGLLADTRTRVHSMIEAGLADPQLAMRPGDGGTVMKGAEWLVGYGEHEAAHHRQIDALIAQLPGGASHE